MAVIELGMQFRRKCRCRLYSRYPLSTLNTLRYEKYGDAMTQEEAIEEAKIALAPFKLVIKSVEWWTLYRSVYLNPMLIF